MRFPPCSPKQLSQIKAQIIKSQNPHTLNTLLISLTNKHTPHFTFYLYNQMLQNPQTHNHFTFNHALKTCCVTHSFNKGQEIHSHVIKTGYFSHTHIQNSFIHFYILQHDIVYAYRVFESVVYPNVVSWTSIVSGFSKCGFESKAVFMFSLMDVEPNANTLVSVLSACCSSSFKGLKLGKSVHCYGLKCLDNNVIFNNALLNFYAKIGTLENARKVFDEMPERDVVSWSTIIGCFVKWGLCENAISVFNEMVERCEVRPNEATIVNVLAACASLGTLSLCEKMHDYVRGRLDVCIEGNVGNALVNMYVKSGSMRKAIRVFKALEFKDIVSWSTLISGVAINGLGQHDTLSLFGLMLVHGVIPDDVTFISLLTSCSHSGLVDEGMRFFNAMVNVYGITANERHCACIVDLYARAGRLKEAEEFVMGMCVEPDGPVWGALVSACRVHGNETMLQRIGQALVEKGVNGGTMALVSNSYASSSRWDESMEIRNVMSCLGLKKMAGRSWIELDV